MPLPMLNYSFSMSFFFSDKICAFNCRALVWAFWQSISRNPLGNPFDLILYQPEEEWEKRVGGRTREREKGKNKWNKKLNRETETGGISPLTIRSSRVHGSKQTIFLKWEVGRVKLSHARLFFLFFNHYSKKTTSTFNVFIFVCCSSWKIYLACNPFSFDFLKLRR